MKKALCKLALVTGVVAMFYMASEFDKETLLLECVQNSDGTDTECRECYIQIYGQAPSDEECLQRH